MIEAFSQDLVSRVTGLSRRQLEYWDRTYVISPSAAPFEGRGYQRLYSFRDLIKLKVAAAMRQRGLRPSRIRLAIHELESRGFADPSVTLTFAVQPDGREILYVDPSLDKPLSVRHVDQIAEPMDIPLRDIKTGLEATIAELTRRPTGQIAQVRDLVGRELVVAGTRVPPRRSPASWNVAGASTASSQHTPT